MTKTLATIWLPGRPAILKNSKQVVRIKQTGRTLVLESKAAAQYRKGAMMLMRAYWKGKPPINAPVAVKMTFNLAMHATNENMPDLSNLYQMPEDLLQAAGIIEDDRLIMSHDGSRRVLLCDTCNQRPMLKSGPRKGKRKDSCGAVNQCPTQGVKIEVMEAKEVK